MGATKEIRNPEKIYLHKNLQIIFCVTLMAVIGIFSLSPAFPKMVKELQISSRDVGLLITVFNIPGVLLVPVMGVLADLFGRKKVLVPSLMIFGVAGGICFFIRDFKILLMLRFFQGIGAAPLSSLNVTLIGDLYSGKRRTAAMGYNQSVFSVGAASFTAIGGALAMIGWYYPFALPLVAIPVGILVMFLLKNSSTKLKQPTEFKKYLSSVRKTLWNPQVIIIYTATIVTFIIVSGSYATYFPLLIGVTYNAVPFIIGIIMSSMTIASALSSSQMGRIAQAFPERTVFRAAFLLYALALVAIPLISKIWLFLIPASIFGIAQGINLPVIQTLLGGISSTENRAIIMSLYGTMLRLGQTLGPLLMGLVFAISGMSGVFYVCSCLALAMFGLIIITIKHT